MCVKLCKIVPNCAKACKTMLNCAKLCKMFELSLVLHALAHFGTVWQILTQFSEKKFPLGYIRLPKGFPVHHLTTALQGDSHQRHLHLEGRPGDESTYGPDALEAEQSPLHYHYPGRHRRRPATIPRHYGGLLE